jgi:hypothetical protein
MTTGFEGTAENGSSICYSTFSFSRVRAGCGDMMVVDELSSFLSFPASLIFGIPKSRGS